MLKLNFSTRFKKDYKNMIKQGKDLRKIKAAFYDLIMENSLPKELLDHSLTGNYTKHRELHLEPDWLLIYMIKDGEVTAVRTGTHSDLF